MCGIAGYVDAGAVKAPKPKCLDQMLDAMAHRGPDGRDSIIRRRFGLGVVRLAVIDLDAPAGPSTDESGKIHLVFNGEIYNHKRLRAELESKGHRFLTHTDTEVLVHLYEEEGEKAINRLQGMFAFALWDDRQKKLWCGRDRMGIKPFYYIFKDGAFYFASEMTALARASGLEMMLDKARIPLLLSMQYVPGPQTLIKGVRKLLPGHTLTIARGRLRKTRYWGGAITQGQGLSSSHGKDAEAFWSQRIIGYLRRSVRQRLQSDVPFGIFLSGGLDSAMVAAMAIEEVGPIPTFSVGFHGGGKANELTEALRLSRHFGTEHSQLVMRPEGLPDVLAQWVKVLDEPIADPAALPTFFLSLFARRKVTMVLTGEGADELFGGYRRHVMDATWGGGAGRLRRLMLGMLSPFIESPSRRRIKQAAKALNLPHNEKRYLQWSRMLTEEPLRRVLGRELESRWEEQQLEVLYEKFFSSKDHGAGNFLENTLSADRATWLPDDLLLKVDRMSMAAGLEARVPFLDHRMVELSLQIPANMKVRKGRGKWILKQASKGLVPSWVRRRKKHGLDVPVGQWLRGPLREYADSILRSKQLKERGVLNPQGVEKMFQEHCDGRADWGLPLWGMMTLELWLRDRFDS